MKPVLLIFAVGLMAGAAVAWQKGAPPVAAAEVGIAAPPPSRQPPKKWEMRDFMALVADPGIATEEDEVPNFLTGQLAGWSDAELRKALDDALASPDCVLDGGSHHSLVGMMMGEWMRRDLAAALAWFEAIPAESTRGELSSWLSLYWPADKAEEGLAYAVAHPAFFAGNGGSRSWKIIHRALESAAKRGPDAVADCLATVRENGLKIAGGDLHFPLGFDFQQLAGSGEVAKFWEGGRGIFFAEAWLKHDRAAAFAGIVEHATEAGQSPVPYLFPTSTRSAPEEQRERATLLARWLDGSDESERGKLIDGAVKACLIRPDALDTLGKSLSDSADRDRVHGGALRGIRTMGTAAALAHVEAYGTPAARLELLETFEPLPAQIFGRGKMSAAEETALREKLGAWGATAEKTESIVGRLQGFLK